MVKIIDVSDIPEPIKQVREENEGTKEETVEMISEARPPPQHNFDREVTFIFAMSIPGSGKTKIKNEISNLTLIILENLFEKEKISNVKLFDISSDDIRGKLTQERIEKHGQLFADAFEATQKSAKKEFDQTFTSIIDSIAEDKETKNFAIFVDKNFVPNQIKDVRLKIKYSIEKLYKAKIGLKTICLVPDCIPAKSRDIDHKRLGYYRNNPLSYNYLLQTYMRVQRRSDHPTIKPSENQLKPVQISWFFFRQFDKVEFKMEENDYRIIDEKLNGNLAFNKILSKVIGFDFS
jgi:hypothetical protein